MSDTFKPDYQAHPDGGVLRELARLTERNAALKAEVERLEAKLRAEERRADRLYTIAITCWRPPTVTVR